MKKVLLLLGLILIVKPLFAGQTIERHNFYSIYDPTSQTFVYDKDGATTTGDQVAVNTYTQKTIQITGVTVGEDIQIRIEGRLKDQVNTRSGAAANWAILDIVDFGSASDDNAINQVIDVTEYVDFLRVGIRSRYSSGNSTIDIEGIFTNIER